jgi:hypothetical protein
MDWRINNTDRSAQAKSADIVIARCKASQTVFGMAAKRIKKETPFAFVVGICDTINANNGRMTVKQSAALHDHLSHPKNAYVLALILNDIAALDSESEADRVCRFYGNDPQKMAAEILELRAKVAELEKFHNQQPPKAKSRNEFFN